MLLTGTVWLTVASTYVAPVLLDAMYGAHAVVMASTCYCPLPGCSTFNSGQVNCVCHLMPASVIRFRIVLGNG